MRGSGMQPREDVPVQCIDEHLHPANGVRRWVDLDAEPG
jgi:hypothetical protein